MSWALVRILSATCFFVAWALGCGLAYAWCYFAGGALGEVVFAVVDRVETGSWSQK